MHLACQFPPAWLVFSGNRVPTPTHHPSGWIASKRTYIPLDKENEKIAMSNGIDLKWSSLRLTFSTFCGNNSSYRVQTHTRLSSYASASLCHDMMGEYGIRPEPTERSIRLGDQPTTTATAGVGGVKWVRYSQVDSLSGLCSSVGGGRNTRANIIDKTYYRNYRKERKA